MSPRCCATSTCPAEAGKVLLRELPSTYVLGCSYSAATRLMRRGGEWQSTDRHYFSGYRNGTLGRRDRQERVCHQSGLN